MTIYVDEIVTYKTKRYVKQSCYMATNENTLNELFNMAIKIGLQVTWLKIAPYPHFELTPNKRELAIKYGAIPCDSKELINQCLILPIIPKSKE